MTYRAGDITQEITTRRTKIPNVNILEAVEGNGHLISLEKSYLKELKSYLGRIKEETRLQNVPVVFIAENPMVARQACAIWKKQLEEVKKHEEKPIEEEEYDYDLLTIEPEKKQEGIIEKNEIMVITKLSQEKNVEGQEMPAMVCREEGVSLGNVYRDFGNLLAQTETLLIEESGISNPDMLVDDLLKLDIPQLAVSIYPRGSYKYVVKRLSFEGDFQVITLGNPKLEDYVDYGKRFAEHFGYFPEAEANILDMVSDLAAYRGNLMTEADIYRHLRTAFKKADFRGEKVLRKDDLQLDYYGMENPMDELESMIGLETAKNTLMRFLAAKKVIKGKNTYQHLIFSGYPGTGKSCLARIFASVMGKMGLSNGRFVDASRADLIGKYVGHTAAQLQKIFEKADGGVLFIDEASFLLEDDRFVKEAVIELVRFMELYPQTTVIFATYPKEAEALLECDPGLASRIYQTISFENYSKEQLWEIAKVMAKKYEFEIAEECKDILEEYLEKLSKNENYGNAREVRKLLQTVMEEYGLAGKKGNILDLSCFQMAIKFLEKKKTKKNSFGFSI